MKKIEHYYNKIIIFFIILISNFSIIYAKEDCNGTDCNFKAPADLFPCDGPDCNFEDLIMLAKGIFQRLFKYALILAPIFIAYAGYLYISGSYSSEKRSQANKILKSIVISLGLMMISWTIVSLFLKIFANDEILKQSPILIK